MKGKKYHELPNGKPVGLQLPGRDNGVPQAYTSVFLR